MAQSDQELKAQQSLRARQNDARFGQHVLDLRVQRRSAGVHGNLLWMGVPPSSQGERQGLPHSHCEDAGRGRDSQGHAKAKRLPKRGVHIAAHPGYERPQGRLRIGARDAKDPLVDLTLFGDPMSTRSRK